MAEQLGTGGSDGNVIPGSLKVGGSIGFGIDPVAAPVLAAMATTNATTTVGAKINEVVEALGALNLITVDEGG